jgi:N-acetyl-anhydromuramyl-L-alanine amidase AmpD
VRDEDGRAALHGFARAGVDESPVGAPAARGRECGTTEEQEAERCVRGVRSGYRLLVHECQEGRADHALRREVLVGPRELNRLGSATKCFALDAPSCHELSDGRDRTGRRARARRHRKLGTCFEHHADRHGLVLIRHDPEHAKPAHEIRRGARLAELPFCAGPPTLPENRADLRHRSNNVVSSESDTLHGRAARTGSRGKVDGEAPARIDEKLTPGRERLVDVRILRELPNRCHDFHSTTCSTMLPVGCGADSPGGRVPYDFIESEHRTTVRDRTISVVVIHTMEIGERDGAAEACAAWFASPLSEVSAHYCVDATTIIQCVREADVAWHARGGNTNSIGIELAGYAGQDAGDWRDEYSQAVIERAARLTADVCARYEIPIRRLRASGLVAGRRGITGHADVSAAFHRSDHWDPGLAFPWISFLQSAKRARASASV